MSLKPVALHCSAGGLSPIASALGAFLVAGCVADVHPEKDNSPIAQHSSALTVTDGYSWQAADAYLSASAGAFVELCCSECSSEYLAQLQRWDLARNNYRAWQ